MKKKITNIVPKYSLGYYQVTYDNGMIQYKHLIPTDKYNTEYKKISEWIIELEKINKLGNLGRIKDFKEELMNKFSDNFFVVDSPMGQAIETGIMVLPRVQGGCHPIKIVKI